MDPAYQSSYNQTEPYDGISDFDYSNFQLRSKGFSLRIDFPSYDALDFESQGFNYDAQRSVNEYIFTISKDIKKTKTGGFKVSPETLRTLYKYQL